MNLGGNSVAFENTGVYRPHLKIPKGHHFKIHITEVAWASFHIKTREYDNQRPLKCLDVPIKLMEKSK